MIEQIELDHGITLDVLGSTCYLDIHYARAAPGRIMPITHKVRNLCFFVVFFTSSAL